MITPHQQQSKLAEAIGLKDLYFKREDLHPYGSHKGRSIPLMIDNYCKNGDQHFVISSSGNAALAAALHINKLSSDKSNNGFDLDIFVGKHIAPNKLQKLKKVTNEHVRVLIKERPLQALIQVSQEGLRSLRQSTDDMALIGYQSLAEEIKNIDEIGAVFMGASSGTTAQALAQYFISNKVPIQMHIIQTSSCHPLAQEFEAYEGPNEISTADAIVDQTAQRKSAVVPLIKKTGGNGWIASNDDIRSAQELVKKYTGLDISANGALSIVGAMKASYVGWKINGVVVCVIGGK